VKGVADVLHGTLAPNGDIYRVFGNIWSPAAVAATFQKYYADGSLRLDHYYPIFTLPAVFFADFWWAPYCKSLKK